ncbi:MAG: oxidoreductase [Novosphingobium sp.]|nr:oxidoreductase [Novosphingobium sp.]
MAQAPRVWLVTGCSSGFGAEIARQALEQGEIVIATARRPETLAGLQAGWPETCLALPLDVCDAVQRGDAVAAALSRFGRIDVLVNNAGVSYLASIEEADEARYRALFETNFFGPMALLREILPHMRARRSGRIVNFSSIGGIAAYPASGWYAATKFALEAASEALAAEVAPLGIKVSLVEPGPFRTGMDARAEHAEGGHPDYEETVGARRRQFRATGNDFPGDPVRGAGAVLELAKMEDPPLRLILGAPALQVARAKFEGVLAEWTAHAALSLSCDYPLPAGNAWDRVVKGA